MPDGGSIRVLGLHPIEDRYEITERLGAQLQESRLQDRIKVSEALELYASFYRNPHQAQEIRQSDRGRDESFWKAYRAYGERAEQLCR